MPVTHEIDPQKECVFIRATGEVSGANLVGVIRAISRDAAFRPFMRLLADYSGASLKDVSSEQIQEIARISNFDVEAKGAIIRSGLLARGLGNLLDAHHEVKGKKRHRYFDTRTEGVRYLNEGYPPEQHVQ